MEAPFHDRRQAHNAPNAGHRFTLLKRTGNPTMDLRTGAETLPKPRANASVPGVCPPEGIRGWRFDGLSFDLRRRELLGRNGAPIPVRPKAEALLRVFLVQPGCLLDRETLMAAVWPDTVVTDDSLVQCVGELRNALDDRDQVLIRTVPRRGYRFEAAVAPLFDPSNVNGTPSSPWSSTPPRTPAPVATAAANIASSESSASTPTFPLGVDGAILRPPSDRRAVAAGGLLAGAVLIGAATVHFRAVPPPVGIDETIAARATVAVLPFVAAEENPVLRHVADTAADDIVTQLASRIGMRGIGRSAIGPFEGLELPLARLNALKATHVVTGRVVPAGSGERVAIDVQLTKLSDGSVIWARRFEGADPRNAGTTSDVGLHVVNAIRNQPGRVRNATPGREPDAADLTLLGWNDLDRRTSLDDVRRARGRFAAALRDDPESIIALNGYAASFLGERRDPMSRLTAADIATLEQTVERVRQLAPEDSTALLNWGSVQLMRGRADLALPAFERANQLVPSYPYGHVFVGQALLLLGRTAEVPSKAERAVELGAGDARKTSNAYLLGAEAALMLEQHAKAEEMARRAIAALPSNAEAHATLAALEALAGRPAEAASQMAAFRHLWPTSTVARYDDLRPSTHPVYLAQRTRLYEGLRRAGLPER